MLATSCAILQLCTPKTLYMHLAYSYTLVEQSTALLTPQSTT